MGMTAVCSRAVAMSSGERTRVAEWSNRGFWLKLTGLLVSGRIECSVTVLL
jgi:hypothetical protein